MKIIKIFLPKQYYLDSYLENSCSIILYGWYSKIDEHQISFCVAPNPIPAGSSQIKQNNSDHCQVIGRLTKKQIVANGKESIVITINNRVIVLNSKVSSNNMSLSSNVLIFVYDHVDYLSVLPFAIPPCPCDYESVKTKSDTKNADELKRVLFKMQRFSSLSVRFFLSLINPIVDKTAVASHFSFWSKFVRKSKTR